MARTKISIIGGSGFVGTNLARLLHKRGCEFEIIDIKESKSFSSHCKIADICDFERLLSSVSGDVIVNLAATHRDDVKDRSAYYKTNVYGAENIIKVAERKDIKKIIFTSSVAVYGFSAPNTDEFGEVSPFNQYGKTKFQAEELFRSWSQKEQRSLIIIRPTVIFGPGNRGNVYNLFNQVYQKRFIMVGNGTNRKSLAYIDNVVDFIDECIKSNEKYKLINYVDGPNLDMNELISEVKNTLYGSGPTRLKVPYFLGLVIGYLSDLISLVSGRKYPISSIRVKKFCSESSFFSRKNEINNFEEKVGLKDAIRHTIEMEFFNKNVSQEIFETE